MKQAAWDRPLLLNVEKLHWTDRSTMQLLTFLERGLRRVDPAEATSRLLLVLTRRTDPADALPGVTEF